MLMILCLIVFLALCFILGAIYNKGIKLKNFVAEAFSTLDVYLKKRWDLIPNLIETTKGYMEHEKGVFEKITELRSKSYNQLSAEQKIQMNDTLTQGLSKIIATAESYPDLKASENFKDLSAQLAKAEEDIANSRKYYNGTVREFNTFIETFPVCLFAPIFSFTKQKMFEMDEAQRENVKVSF